MSLSSGWSGGVHINVLLVSNRNSMMNRLRVKSKNTFFLLQSVLEFRFDHFFEFLALLFDDLCLVGLGGLHPPSTLPAWPLPPEHLHLPSHTFYSFRQL